MRPTRTGSLTQRDYPQGTRSGFTLIELLIVMVILLLLAGLLLGAVLLVRKQVAKAQQVAELTQIDLALTNFKSKYGIYPPSRIRLRNWIVNPVTSGQIPYELSDPFDAHSVSYLRRIWPSIKLPITSNGNPVESPTSNLVWYVDNSGAGTSLTHADLEGDQCLVFFLGGIAERRGTNEFVLHGFTDDSANPSRIPDSGTPRTLTRIQPFFNFDMSRLYVRIDYTTLIDTGNRLAERSGTGIVDFYPVGGPSPAAGNYLGRLPSYKVIGADTSYPLPIAYFSAYEGRGYRPDDLNIPEPITAGTGTDEIYFQLVWPALTQNPTGSATPLTQQSLEPNPYSRNAANPAARTGAAGSVIQCYNPKTYQMILPGPDNQYGAGGSQLDYSGAGWTENEDNIANFAGGTPVGEFVTQQQK